MSVAASAMLERPVDVAIVTPVFKHPGLLAETVASVLAQEGGLNLRLILVDDGCPFPETGLIASAYAAAHPGLIYHLRQANGGLSAARNAGIAFATSCWPDLRAIYMLDADNRIAPHGLRRMLEALLQAPADVGWVYPDINAFGFPVNYDTAGDYSLYFHLSDNFCEAGSLIRREVFDRGPRFDETLKLGFEDWEFWLQANLKGFKGKHVANAGFRYRRRAESMLTDAERDRAEILTALRRKHRELFGPRSVLALEQAEAPRYALVTDSGPMQLTTDPEAPRERAQLARDWRGFLRALGSEGRLHFPSFIAFATGDALRFLKDINLSRWVLWRCELLLEHVDVAVLTIGPTVEEETLGFSECFAADAAVILPRAVLVVVSATFFGRCVKGEVALSTWSFSGPEPAVRLGAIELRAASKSGRILPSLAGARLGFMLSELEGAQAIWRQGRPRKPSWRQYTLRHRLESHRISRELVSAWPLLPLDPQSALVDIGFVLPLAQFGGVERCVMNYAATARAHGWRPHLFIFDTPTVHVPDEFRETFASINFLGEAGLSQWQGEQAYFGAPPSAWATQSDHKAALGLLASMSVVVNNHSIDAHALMAKLRRLGAKTVAGMHLIEQGKFDRPIGQAHVLLAYEHAYDLFTVISDDLRAWCNAAGVPASKLVTIRNAPSYSTGAHTIAAARDARRKRLAIGLPLRLVFLGRLDHQKGLERLLALYQRTSGMPELFEWRIVGKRVLADGHRADLGAIDTVLEPAIFDLAELDQLYAWADILVLPSRFEGVPLTILEAARLGCVCCATDTGAVAEVIEHDVDGLLIPASGSDDEIAALYLDALLVLAGDRERLQRLSDGAAARAGGASWSANMAEFFAVTERLLKGLPR